MHVIPKSCQEWGAWVLYPFKAYIVLCPLICAALIRGLALEGDVAEHWVAVGCFVSCVVLLFAGIMQLALGLRQAASWSYVLAGVAVFWIMAWW
jgi:hypothetical protein